MLLALWSFLLITSTSSTGNLIPNIPVSDSFILNFSLMLKYLQLNLYKAGLATYAQKDFVTAGFEDPFYANLRQIYFDEQSHAILLNNVLNAAGIEPTVPLQYDFPSVDVESFVRLASIVGGVSVSA